MLMPSIFRENLFDDFVDDFARPVHHMMNYGSAQANVMKTDVKETDNGYELHIDLPGYKKDDVKAQLKDGYMTISAQTSSSKEDKDEQKKYIRRERYYGNCSRSFYVGEQVKEEDIKAKFEDGILKISIPKKDPEKAVEENRYIAIEG